MSVQSLSTRDLSKSSLSLPLKHPAFIPVDFPSHTPPSPYIHRGVRQNSLPLNWPQHNSYIPISHWAKGSSANQNSPWPGKRRWANGGGRSSEATKSLMNLQNCGTCDARRDSQLDSGNNSGTVFWSASLLYYSGGVPTPQIRSKHLFSQMEEANSEKSPVSKSPSVDSGRGSAASGGMRRKHPISPSRKRRNSSGSSSSSSVGFIGNNTGQVLEEPKRRFGGFLTRKGNKSVSSGGNKSSPSKVKGDPQGDLEEELERKDPDTALTLSSSSRKVSLRESFKLAKNLLVPSKVNSSNQVPLHPHVDTSPTKISGVKATITNLSLSSVNIVTNVPRTPPAKPQRSNSWKPPDIPEDFESPLGHSLYSSSRTKSSTLPLSTKLKAPSKKVLGKFFSTKKSHKEEVLPAVSFSSHESGKTPAVEEERQELIHLEAEPRKLVPKNPKISEIPNRTEMELAEGNVETHVKEQDVAKIVEGSIVEGSIVPDETNKGHETDMLPLAAFEEDQLLQEGEQKIPEGDQEAERRDSLQGGTEEVRTEDRIDQKEQMSSELQEHLNQKSDQEDLKTDHNNVIIKNEQESPIDYGTSKAVIEEALQQNESPEEPQILLVDTVDQQHPDVDHVHDMMAAEKDIKGIVEGQDHSPESVVNPESRHKTGGGKEDSGMGYEHYMMGSIHFEKQKRVPDPDSTDKMENPVQDGGECHLNPVTMERKCAEMDMTMSEDTDTEETLDDDDGDVGDHLHPGNVSSLSKHDLESGIGNESPQSSLDEQLEQLYGQSPYCSRDKNGGHDPALSAQFVSPDAETEVDDDDTSMATTVTTTASEMDASFMLSRSLALTEDEFSYTESFKQLKPFQFDHVEPILEGKRERLYKVLVVGELGTGKTSMIKRYVHQFFSQHYRATIGVDFALKVLRWDSETVVRLQLWDIAGQERFGSMTRVYYKEAVGAFVVFDVTRAATLEAVPKWKADLDAKVVLPDGRPIPTVLLANKSDQPKEGIAANRDKMNEFCAQQGFSAWFETSAKDNINIDESANFLVSKILEMDKWSQEPLASDPEKLDLSANGKHKSGGAGNCSC